MVESPMHHSLKLMIPALSPSCTHTFGCSCVVARPRSSLSPPHARSGFSSGISNARKIDDVKSLGEKKSLCPRILLFSRHIL